MFRRVLPGVNAESYLATGSGGDLPSILGSRTRVDYPRRVDHESRSSKPNRGQGNKYQKRGNLMCLVKVEVPKPTQIGSVMTLESLEELDLKNGDEVEVVVKAVNVLLIRR